MRKTFIALFAAPFIAIILAIAGALVALNWPTLVVNDTTLGMLARHLAPFGIKAEWKTVETNSVSHGAFDETLTIDFTDLCVGVRPSVEKACFAKATGSVRYRFFGIVPHIASLGPISLEGGTILVHTSDEKSDFWKNFSIKKIRLPKILTRASLLPIDVSIDSLKIEGEQQGPTISGKAKIDPDESGNIEEISASARVISAGGQNTEIAATARSASNFKSGDWRIEGDVRTSLGKGGSLAVAVKFKTDDGKEIDHDLKVVYAKDKLRGNFELEGIIEDKLLESSLAGTLTGISEMAPSASLDGCQLELKRVTLRKNRGKLAFTCPLAIKLKDMDLPDVVDPIYEQPKKVFLDLTAAADTFFFPDLDEKTKATVEARVRPQKSKLVRTTGHIQVDLDGVPSKPMNSWKVSSDVDLDFTIDSFKNLVKVLERSPWPVPAPFYVLDGKVEFSLMGSGSTETGRAVFPASLTTKLSSKNQSLDVESKGKAIFFLGRGEIGRIELDLDANFNDVQIELPSLSLAAIPQFTPDRRIELEPKADRERAETDLDYDIKMKTPSERPIKILSNITPTFIPLSLNIDLKKKDVSGTIEIRDFPIHFFKRSGTLNSFELNLKKPTNKSKISGSMTVPYDNFKIIISVAGTLGEPSWALSSKPPMSRGDIISTLLYGEPLEAIGSDSAASVSSMNAAMADKKISLTTFLLIATTPIQSLGYNSETGTFSARIRLAKKTSIVASSNEEEKTVGIRQRLGHGFSIVTGWEKWDDSSSSSGAAAGYIEWSKRW